MSKMYPSVSCEQLYENAIFLFVTYYVELLKKLAEKTQAFCQ